jgi:Mrp family chromosome partitioning ATPase
VSLVPPDSGPELRDYVAVLRRRWRVVAAGVVLGVLAGLAVSVLQPRVYTSSASVLVEPVVRDVFDGRTPPDRMVDLASERELLLSTRVAAAAGQRLDPPRSAEEMERAVAAANPGGLLLQVTFTAATPEAAQAGAQAYAESYLAARREQAEATIEQSRAPLRLRLQEAEAELSQVVDDLVADRDPSRVASAQIRRDVLVDQVGALQRELAALDAIDTSGGGIVDPAPLPQGAAGAPPGRLLLVGGLVGLVAGVVGAYLRDRLDPRMVDPERDLEPLGLAVLADLGPRSGEEWSLDPEEVARLRNRLLALHPRSDGGAVTLFTGLGDAPSGPLAGDYGRVLSRVRRGVLLVDADLRRPLAGAETPARPGLAQVLAGERSLDAVVLPLDDVEGLAFLPAGRPAGSPSDLLQPDRLDAFLAAARKGWGEVVVAAPPALASGDELSLAGFCDAVVLCVSPRRVRLPALSRAVAQLRAAGGQLAGVVLLRGRA